jgi:L-2-hydroxyglutarate oxidase LhgO
VRVVEHSVLWKEKEASKVFTYQGLTTCTEVDRSWTIMSSTYNHVRNKKGEDERDMEEFIQEEEEHQERLEAAGYRSPTWRACELYNPYFRRHGYKKSQR